MVSASHIEYDEGVTYFLTQAKLVVFDLSSYYSSASHRRGYYEISTSSKTSFVAVTDLVKVAFPKRLPICDSLHR